MSVLLTDIKKKMKWKNLKYWQKGAIIGFIFSLIPLPFILFGDKYTSVAYAGKFYFPIYVLFEILFKGVLLNKSKLLLLSLTSIVVYTLFCSLIGFMIDLLKRYKKTNKIITKVPLWLILGIILFMIAFIPRSFEFFEEAEVNGFLFTFIGFLPNFGLYFIIGAFIGLVIDNLKNRKKFELKWRVVLTVLGVVFGAYPLSLLLIFGYLLIIKGNLPGQPEDLIAFLFIGPFVFGPIGFLIGHFLDLRKEKGRWSEKIQRSAGILGGFIGYFFSFVFFIRFNSYFVPSQFSVLFLLLCFTITGFLLGKLIRKLISKQKLILTLVLIFIPILLFITLNYAEKIRENLDLKLIESAKNTKDINLCTKIFFLRNIGSCYWQLAVGTRSITLCQDLDKIRDSYNKGNIVFYLRGQPDLGANKNKCMYDVNRRIMEYAEETRNYEDCQENTECLYKLSVELNDSNKCYELEEEKKNLCFFEIAKSTKNQELCNETYESIRQQCFQFFYDLTGQPELCFEVGIWNSTCFYDYALKNNDINYCKYTAEKIDECIYTVAIAKNASLYCEDTGSLQGKCYYHFAKKSKDLGLCDMSAEFREECYYDMAISQKNPSLCLQYRSYADKCYFVLANKAKDPSLCFKINSSTKGCLDDSVPYLDIRNFCTFIGDAVSNCIYQSSFFSLKAEYCQYIKNSYYMGRCYRNIGIELLDYSLCDLSKEFKENCYFNVAVKRGDEDKCVFAGPWRSECFDKTE